MSPARHSITPDQARTCRFPMPLKNGTMLSMFTTLQFNVRSCGSLVESTNFFWERICKCLFDIVGPAPILSRTITTYKSFDLISVEILTRYHGLQMKDLTYCRPWSTYMILTYSTVFSGTQTCVFPVRSIWFCESVLVSMNMTLLICAWRVRDESFCVMFDTT